MAARSLSVHRDYWAWALLILTSFENFVIVLAQEVTLVLLYLV